MPRYPGRMLYEYRLGLPRPKWANEVIVRRDYNTTTLKEMTAMINYSISRKAIDKRMAWRSYERWEQSTFPEWFRMGLIWINPDVVDILDNSEKYTILKGGKYSSAPTLMLHESIEVRTSKVRIDPKLL